jgi:hypothetical protein
VAADIGLVEFLRARLDEDEAAAKAAHPGPWTYETEVGGFGPVGWVRVPLPMHKGAYTGLTRFTPLGTQDAETCAHIARHDPARVLREVDAKRALLAGHEGVHRCDWGEHRGPDMLGGWCKTVCTLAAVYSDHPDYQESWKP